MFRFHFCLNKCDNLDKVFPFYKELDYLYPHETNIHISGFICAYTLVSNYLPCAGKI